MPYRFNTDAGGRKRLELPGEPPWCHVLALRPGTLAALKGRWLLLGFAPWSRPDLLALQAALAWARDAGPGLQLGLLPYDDIDDLTAGFPELAVRAHGPFWGRVDGGVLQAARTGLLAPAEIAAFVQQPAT